MVRAQKDIRQWFSAQFIGICQIGFEWMVLLPGQGIILRHKILFAQVLPKVIGFHRMQSTGSLKRIERLRRRNVLHELGQGRRTIRLG
jgi:hypothetical protein